MRSVLIFGVAASVIYTAVIVLTLIFSGHASSHSISTAAILGAGTVQFLVSAVWFTFLAWLVRSLYRLLRRAWRGEPMFSRAATTDAQTTQRGQ